MKLRSTAILFAFVLASAVASCQVGVYATVGAEQFTRTGLYQSPPAGTSNTDSPWLYGPTVGLYYTVSHIPKLGTLKTGPVALGIDLRGDFFRTSNPYSRDDGIISLRVTPKSPIFKTVPYVQAGAGIGHTKVFPPQLTYTNNWSYVLAVGVDRKLKGRLDWRVIDASAGFMGNYVSGTSQNNSNYEINLGTGVVVRLGGK